MTGPVGVSRPVPDLRPIVAALAAFAVAYYFALTRLVRGDLLNSYPFVTADGFDWMLEGYAVARWLDGVTIPELPVARSPGFVSVTFADFQVGANGDLMFAVIAAAVFISLAGLLLIARWERIPRYQAAVVVLVLAVSPLAFFRMWVLSDQVATALLVVAAVALYPYLTRGSRTWLAVATVAAALGGATQTYGMMPFLVVGGWCFAVSAWRRQADRLLAAAVVAGAVGAVGLLRLWQAAVPHTNVPEQTGLIEFSFGMFGFYANAWTFAFLPLLPLLAVLAAYRWREVLASPVLTGYWLSVLALMGSTFFYQWKDFRFTIPTAFMLGVAVMATLPGERPLPRPRQLMTVTAVLAVFVGFFLAPANYWVPKWPDIDLDPSNNYLAKLLQAEPRDRFAIETHCQSSFEFCAEVPLPDNLPPYNRNVISTYQNLVNAE